MIASILLIIGGLNWGLFGVWNMDVVASIFGAGSTAALVIYDLIGISAIWRIVSWYKGCCEVCHK
jgi:uncharacterized membrane protein YuzA (DUF378 family)